MAHLKKTKTKDFRDVTVEKCTFLKSTVKLLYVLKNFNKGTLWQKVGTLSCIVLSPRSAKNSHTIQIPFAIFACKDLRKFVCLETFVGTSK